MFVLANQPNLPVTIDLFLDPLERAAKYLESRCWDEILSESTLRVLQKIHVDRVYVIDGSIDAYASSIARYSWFAILRGSYRNGTAIPDEFDVPDRHQHLDSLVVTERETAVHRVLSRMTPRYASALLLVANNASKAACMEATRCETVQAWHAVISRARNQFRDRAEEDTFDFVD